MCELRTVTSVRELVSDGLLIVLVMSSGGRLVVSGRKTIRMKLNSVGGFDGQELRLDVWRQSRDSGRGVKVEAPMLPASRMSGPSLILPDTKTHLSQVDRCNGLLPTLSFDLGSVHDDHTPQLVLPLDLTLWCATRLNESN